MQNIPQIRKMTDFYHFQLFSYLWPNFDLFDPQNKKMLKNMTKRYSLEYLKNYIPKFRKISTVPVP